MENLPHILVVIKVKGISIAFIWASRPASGFHFLPRIGELQDTLMDVSLKSQDSEILDDSEWDLHR